jgi:hypothetical protein
VLDAAVGRGHEHLGWEVAGQGEHVEVHLGGEAFGDVGWSDPACEGAEIC